MRFVLVDRILRLEPGRAIEAVKTLPGEDELFQDHFPGFPVVPGVLLTEMMAQAAGKCLMADDGRSGVPMLGKILGASFRDWVRPDEEARIHAEITQSRRGFARAACHVEVEGRRVADAELFFVFIPPEHFAPDYRDEVLEAFLAERESDPGPQEATT